MTSGKPEKSGRPKKPIDFELLAHLCNIHCTDAEIANILGLSQKTIQRKKKDDPEFLEVYEMGKAAGKRTIRAKQFEAAEALNPQMLIWLGRQLLGQTDHHYIKLNLNRYKTVSAKMERIIKAVSKSDISLEEGQLLIKSLKTSTDQELIEGLERLKILESTLIDL